MREIVGFVMGAAAGAAGALFMSSPEGKALVERLRAEARPEVERATSEWEPVLNEVARAVRLAVREVETATVDLRARIADIAAAPEAAEVAAEAAAEVTAEAAPGVAAEAPETPEVAAEAALEVDADTPPADPGPAALTDQP